MNKSIQVCTRGLGQRINHTAYAWFRSEPLEQANTLYDTGPCDTYTSIKQVQRKTIARGRIISTSVSGVQWHGDEQ